MPRRPHTHLGARARLAALLPVLLLLACTSQEPPPPDGPEELRDRVWTALRGDGDQLLHVQLLLPSIDGAFEVDRETWIDWSTDSIRHAYYGRGDDAPLTLIVGDLQYYPPGTDQHPLSNEVGGLTLEPLEPLVIPLLLLRFTDGSATVTGADLDGDPVWRLEQSGVRAEEEGNEIFCFDVRLDIDAKTYLPRAFGAADCGDPRLSRSLITTEWLDRDDIPDGFFAPETAADFESAL